jgi:hypothetical protein
VSTLPTSHLPVRIGDHHAIANAVQHRLQDPGLLLQGLQGLFEAAILVGDHLLVDRDQLLQGGNLCLQLDHVLVCAVGAHDETWFLV